MGKAKACCISSTKTPVELEYAKIACSYDERWKGYLNATHDMTLSLLTPSIGDNILDASAGTGLLAERMLKTKNVQLTLLDISKEMLDIAKKRLKSSKVIIRKGDVHNLPFAKKFSKIVCASAFQYYSNPSKVLEGFHDALESKGVLVIVDWCRDAWLMKLLDFLTKNKRSRKKIYTLRELRDLMDNSGFKIEKTMKKSFGLWSLMGVRACKK